MADNLFNASQLYEILKEQGLLPDRRPINVGLFDPQTNLMQAETPRTQAHELTHAVQWNLFMDAANKIQDKKRNKEPVSEQENQFLKAAQQMYSDTFGTIGQRDTETASRINQSLQTRQKQIKDLYKDEEFSPNYKDYRTSRRELEAFGVGGSSVKGLGYNENMPHLNPTMAQEFDVLLSLYKRIPLVVRQSFSEGKKKEIESNIKAGRGELKPNSSVFESITSDPFARTIK